ncbi:MAG: hypothetical protein KAR05_04275 [Candidatus Omnitrophica bacterium]|nr:hypothetical protein [Candidatus Omnitrophota bacterium]
MKRCVLFILLVLFAVGCSNGGSRIKMYMDDPKTILEDPMSVNHQDALDNLESRYLRKEITYAEYLKKKRQLEEDYAKEAQKMRDTVEGVR